jgi:DUF1016 N-terminal domain
MDRSLTTRPEGYEDFLQNLKRRIRAAQVKAVFAVNRELILLYWHIGREILERQRLAGWGAKVIERPRRRPAPRISGDDGLFENQFALHARFCRGLAEKVICPTGCWTNPLGAQSSPS